MFALVLLELNVPNLVNKWTAVQLSHDDNQHRSLGYPRRHAKHVMCRQPPVFVIDASHLGHGRVVSAINCSLRASEFLNSVYHSLYMIHDAGR